MRAKTRIDARLVRWAGAVGIGLFGLAMTIATYASAAGRAFPEQAQHYLLADAWIGGLASERMFADASTSRGRAMAAQVARTALIQDPTVVAAVGTLGLEQAAKGDLASAGRLFAYSRWLSRRDLRTSVWEIETGVQRGDVAGVLRDYDIALRTSRAAPALLLPVLYQALEQADIRAELVQTLRGGPPWARQFLFDLGNVRPVPDGAADLYAAVHAARIAIPPAGYAGVIAGLADAGRLDEAWRTYTITRPMLSRRMSRDPAFSRTGDDATLFDWSLSSESGLGAFAERTTTGSRLGFEVAPSSQGLLARQFQLLPPGRYRLDLAGETDSGDGLVLPLVRVVCGDTTTVLTTFELGAGRFERFADFAVPAACPAQWIEVRARSSEAVQPLTGNIGWLSVKPRP